ncbi:hypothetical protein [Thauera sp. WH-1]|uniref:hypothetical protein n=1 Tax=Thauera sp. WH-1 TaxID=3398230 RepID=UPI0039FBD834
MDAAWVRTSRFRAALVVMGAVLALAACTTVRIESTLDPNAVRMERHWGVLAVELPDATSSYVAELRSFGLSRSPFGWTAGYARQSWAALDDECRVVVWVLTREELDAARQLASDSAGLCVASAP